MKKKIIILLSVVIILLMGIVVWFNGMIQETYPAQLGVVYRIIKTQ